MHIDAGSITRAGRGAGCPRGAIRAKDCRATEAYADNGENDQEGRRWRDVKDGSGREGGRISIG